MKRSVGIVVGALSLSAALVGCPESKNDANSKVCNTQQGLELQPIKGTSLAAKQISLTFDDGPAPRTGELSAYLKSENIRAAFFINGEKVAGNNALLNQLVADGHVVANHTQTHKNLATDFPNDSAAIVKELADTDAIIAPFVPNNRFMFRAPFGAYDARTFEVLQASAMSKYVGHIDWDIGSERTATTAADWACWQNEPKLSSAACGDLYVQETNAVGKGIILLHDAPYGDENNHVAETGIGNTIDMVKYMVPRLKSAGYTFVRVDEVPAIATQLPPLPDVFVPDAGPLTDGSAENPPANTSSGTNPAPAPSTSGPGTTPDPCAR